MNDAFRGRLVAATVGSAPTRIPAPAATDAPTPTDAPAATDAPAPPIADAPAPPIADAPAPPIADAPVAPPLQLSDRIAMGRALWRDLVIGFAAQLGDLGMSFSQLAALYAAAGTATLTVADLAEQIGRSASATSRIVSGLERRGLLHRVEEVADRRQRLVRLTPEGQTLLGVVDRARAEEFLAVVRSLPQADRMLVAMGVAALAERVVDRRGRLIKVRPPTG